MLLKPLRRLWEIFFLKRDFAQHERRPNRPIMSILLRSLQQIFPRCSRFVPLLVQIRNRALVIICKFRIELGGQRCRRPARSGIERSASLFSAVLSLLPRLLGLIRASCTAESKSLRSVSIVIVGSFLSPLLFCPRLFGPLLWRRPIFREDESRVEIRRTSRLPIKLR